MDHRHDDDGEIARLDSSPPPGDEDDDAYGAPTRVGEAAYRELAQDMGAFQTAPAGFSPARMPAGLQGLPTDGGEDLSDTAGTEIMHQGRILGGPSPSQPQFPPPAAYPLPPPLQAPPRGPLHNGGYGVEHVPPAHPMMGAAHVVPGPMGHYPAPPAPPRRPAPSARHSLRTEIMIGVVTFVTIALPATIYLLLR